jgi:uncharacterized protein (DUF4415 family)/uncharacterized DUF497 family protein
MAPTIVWDEPKRVENLARHGLDFAYLDEAFFLSAAVVPAKLGRRMAIGRLADDTIAVVFAPLGAERRFGDLDAPCQPQGEEAALMKKREMTDEEEARVQRMIASDPDAPEATDEELAQARPFAEAFPALAEAMRKSAGGRPRSEDPKVAISIRVDRDVVDAFKAGGAGWQSRMNEALRASAGLKRRA